MNKYKATADPKWDWFWDRLVMAAPVLGRRIYNAADGLDPVSSLASVEATDLGLAISTTKTGSSKIQFTHTMDGQSSSERSLFTLLRAETGDGATYDKAVQTGGTAPAPHMGIWHDSDNERWVLSANPQLFSPTGSAKLGEWSVVAGTEDTAELRLYVNGTVVDSSTTLMGSQPISDVYVQRNAGSDDIFRGHIACTYAWSRKLQHNEIQQLTADPWGPFRHYRDTQPGPYQYFNPEVSLQQGGDPLKPKSWSIL